MYTSVCRNWNDVDHHDMMIIEHWNENLFFELLHEIILFIVIIIMIKQNAKTASEEIEEKSVSIHRTHSTLD